MTRKGSKDVGDLEEVSWNRKMESYGKRSNKIRSGYMPCNLIIRRLLLTFVGRVW